MPTPLKIGKYDVIEIIGRGGMGAVYKGTDPRIGRTVAIKIIQGDFSDNPELLKRFYHEAQAVGNLQHPNIVVVYDLGDESGNPYLVMEYLNGVSLAKIIAQRQSVSIVQKLGIVIEVLNALHYAHQHDIVHRDVKPANVMVLKDGHVKLLDFGIARQGDLGQTKTGQMMGTMWYMSPEQLNSEAVDGRGDVYSAGILLYELLAYTLPFDPRDMTGMIVKRLRGDPAPPLSKYLESYPSELDEIIARALAGNRDQRYATAEEFAFELRRLQDRLKRDMVSHYVDQARESIARSDLAQAHELLSEVVRLDTQNQTAKQLLYEIQQTLQKSARNERKKQLQEQAEGAIAAKQLHTAANLAEDAIKLDANDTDLLNLREQIELAKARGQQVKKLLTLAKVAQQTGELAVAKKAVEDALKLDPQDTDAKLMGSAIPRLMVEYGKQGQIQQFLRAARREVEARQFTAAQENLVQAKAIDPAHPEIPVLEKLLNAGGEQEAQQRELAQLCSQIEVELNANRARAGRDLAAKAMRDFPGEPKIVRLKAAAEEAVEEEERRAYIEERIASASRLIEGGEANRAFRMLKDAEREYPMDLQLREYLGTHFFSGLGSADDSGLVQNDFDKFFGPPSPPLANEDRPASSGDVSEANLSSATRQSDDSTRFVQPSTAALRSDAAAADHRRGDLAGSFTELFLAGSKTRTPELEVQFALTFTESADRLQVGRTINVHSVPYRIGRTGCHLNLASDHGVSREHLVFDHEGGAFTITDLKSANGTFVNGHPLRPGVTEILPFGALIRLGNSTAITFSSEQLRELPDLVGQVVGDRFQLLRIIRSGSKSALYEATDPRLRWKAAVKILSPVVAAYPGYLHQFKQEAEIAACLQHPRICSVIDCGESHIQMAPGDEQLVHYLAMTLMDGESLSEHVSPETLFPLERIITFLDDVTGVLKYAHDNGIIHNGIKLSSVVFDQQGKPFVTDFGMATRQGDSGTPSILGSHEFLAPEQWKRLSPTPYVDQFSLAALTYLLVTGSLPFEGQLNERVRERNFRRGPIPVHEEALERGRQGVSSDVSEVLSRAMSVTPEKRYPSVREFFDDFRCAVEGRRGSSLLPRVFISYRRGAEASGWAEYFNTALKRRRIQVFLDTQGADRAIDISAKVRKEIEQCDVFVCLLGTNTLKSTWVHKEIKLACENQKVMIPVFLKGFKPPQDSELITQPHVKTLVGYEAVILSKDSRGKEAVKDMARMVKDAFTKPPPR